MNDSANFRNNSFNMNQSVSNQDRNSLTSNKGSTPANSDSKNASSRMRRKTQEAEDGSLYEINLNRVNKNFFVQTNLFRLITVAEPLSWSETFPTSMTLH